MVTAADDSTPQARPVPAGGIRRMWQRLARTVGHAMPTGLFARSLLIIVTPVVLLQALVAFVFMERNWSAVTLQLAQSTVAEIAAVVDVAETWPGEGRNAAVESIAARFGLNAALLVPEPLPQPGPKPFFSTLDRVLSQEVTRQVGKPFWIDTVGRSNIVEIRIQLSDGILRVFAPRPHSYASNSLVFISWMVVTSAILLAIAIVFLRNQIRPILRLTAAVDDFGKGRPVAAFQPRGAREVRQATVAFHRMRERVERQIDQRTALLAGVSHDLRTVLTRLRLQLALLGDGPDVDALRNDIDDMNRMLDGYLAFARGVSDEDTAPTDIAALIDEVAAEARISGHRIDASFSGDPVVSVRPQGFKRCIANLVGNAGRHADNVAVAAAHSGGHLTITVDDDGPGIPFEEREAVFKPFYRLDPARNLDETGTGLGLPIARDIARGHGGDIELADSPMGGLRAIVTIPA